MAKRIFSVGFNFPGDEAECISFESNWSLLDADIIIFEPRIGYYGQSTISNKQHMGKPLLDESASFKTKERANHWKSELQIALDSGKTIIVFLSELEEFYVYKEKQELFEFDKDLELFSNYSMLPINFDRIVPRFGKEIRIAQDLKFLSAYWKEFAPYSSYKVYLGGHFENAILTTKMGNKIVGAIVSNKKGCLILLPPIRYDIDKFLEEDEYDEEGNELWRPEAIAFGKRLTAYLVDIDKARQSNSEATPPPKWTKTQKYKLAKEVTLEREIESVTKRIEELKRHQTELNLQLEEEGKFRRLLYEGGASLEEAILKVLHLMGFDARRYKEGDSEFDVVFTSLEGRFLGETEGKENRAINIDKLSQLERNLQEDFSRKEVTEYAKGVLFGNAYRLKPLTKRPEFFTQKCITGAKRSKLALIRTPDLFQVAKYLNENNDPDFAKKCREVIKQTEGEIVVFPQIPSSSEVTSDE